MLRLLDREGMTVGSWGSHESGKELPYWNRCSRGASEMWEERKTQVPACGFQSPPPFSQLQKFPVNFHSSSPLGTHQSTALPFDLT